MKRRENRKWMAGAILVIALLTVVFVLGNARTWFICIDGAPTAKGWIGFRIKLVLPNGQTDTLWGQLGVTKNTSKERIGRHLADGLRRLSKAELEAEYNADLGCVVISLPAGSKYTDIEEPIIDPGSTGVPFTIFDDPDESPDLKVFFELLGTGVAPGGEAILGIREHPLISVPTFGQTGLQVIEALTEAFNDLYEELGYWARILEAMLIIDFVPCIEGFTAGTTDPGLEASLGFPPMTVPDDELLCRNRVACPPVGGDPPIFGDIMVFPTPERFLDTDLNGDGDRYDTVLRYKNLQTGAVVNTGLECSGAPHSLDIWEETIVFSAGPEWAIRCYDITTGSVRDTGCVGRNPAIHGDWIAFAGLDGTIQLFHMQEEVAMETDLTGSFPVIFDGVAAFHAGTPSTIWYYDIGTGAAVDTGAVGRTPAIHKNLIAFSTQEGFVQADLNGDSDWHDSAIRYYDLATHTVTNTGATGSWPAIFDDVIVFSTHEGSVAADLNGDGKISALVIQYLHLPSGEVINTRQLGAVPDIYNGTISFHALEAWSELDWSGDGDTYDSVVMTCAVHLDSWALPGEHTEDREPSQEPPSL